MKKNKIILISPKLPNWTFTENSFGNMPALGVIVLATILEKAGYEVQVFDGRWDENYYDNVIKQLDDILFVGISVMTIQISDALKVAKLIKDNNKKVPIVFGGIHPTLLPEETIKDELVDIVAYGEGENTVLELVEALTNKSSLLNVKGIYYKNKGKIIKTAGQKKTNLDSIPFHNFDFYKYDGFMDVNRDIFGIYKNGEMLRMVPLYTGLGCPYRCAFCFEPYVNRTYRSKSPKRIIDECRYLVEKYKLNHIYFRNDNFFTYKREVEEFLDLKLESGLKFTWDAQLRANYFNEKYIDDAFLIKMKNAGMKRMMIGAESGSIRILEKIKKDIIPEQIIKSAEMAFKHNIEVQYPFILGIPGENEEDLYKTLELVNKLKEVNPFVLIAYFLFRPIPGAELFDESVKLGMVKPTTLKEWGDPELFDNPDNMPWVKNIDLINDIKRNKVMINRFTVFDINSEWLIWRILTKLEINGKLDKEKLSKEICLESGYDCKKINNLIISLNKINWIGKKGNKYLILEAGIGRLQRLEEKFLNDIRHLRMEFSDTLEFMGNMIGNLKNFSDRNGILVYGAGKYGKEAVRGLKRHNFKNIYLVDEKIDISNKFIFGIKVNRLKDIDFNKVKIVIITSKTYYKEIKKVIKTHIKGKNIQFINCF